MQAMARATAHPARDADAFLLKDLRDDAFFHTFPRRGMGSQSRGHMRLNTAKTS